MSGHAESTVEPTDIAIVGMAGRFPGARDLDAFWELIASGQCAVERLSTEQLAQAGVAAELRGDPAYVPVSGSIEDVECFDAEFFGIGPRDAALMDPQHRHFLEVCWEALEDSCHVPSRFPGSIGVYAGSGVNGYIIHNLLPNKDLVDPLGFFAVRHTANDKDFLSTGVSYRLNLRGPSVNVQTACSTSLVAIHLAAQALIAGECDLALAGGVTIEVPHGQGYLYREGEILSRDGVCRAFDAASSGTVLTSGAGAVVLRRLGDAIADGDHIYSVVKATAINNDGAEKVGYLAPSVSGHAAVVAEAQELAGISPDSIQYLEAHGTGTPVGDPIEIAALTQAFGRGTNSMGFARLGSTKPTIGHLDTAAGVASVIKTSLALTHQVLPPMANYTGENPLLDLASTPFVLSGEASVWPRLATPRRAGVSSLGVGGTNAHAILEEAPAPSSPGEDADSDRMRLLPLSAKTQSALARARERLAAHLERHPELPLDDVAFSLQEGREAFAWRLAVSASTREQAVSRLRSEQSATCAAEAPSVVFMFPGGGAQYPNMGRELYEAEPVYRETLERCLDSLDPVLGSAVRDLLFPEPEHIEAAAEHLALPSVQLPAIFATEYALAIFLMSRGLVPTAMTGHSLGEYVAACIAGVFSVGDAMRIVALRGRIMERLDDAAMLSVALPEKDLRILLTPGVSLAAVNAPELCLVSGAAGPIGALESTLGRREVPNRRLRFKGAVHCSLLDPHLEEFRRFFDTVTLRRPSIPFISNVTGEWVRGEEVTTPDYWVRHLRHTVRFADGLAALLQDPNRILIEVGPGNTLATLARQQPGRLVTAIHTLAHPSEQRRADESAYDAIGRAWAAGAIIDWSKVRAHRRCNRVSLPPYSFERTRHWFEATRARAATEVAVLPPEQWAFRPSWRRSDLIGQIPHELPEEETWLVAGSGKLAERVAKELRLLGADVVRVRAEKSFSRRSAWDYSVGVADRAGWDAVSSELKNFRQAVTGVVWALPAERLTSEDAAFFGLLDAVQSLYSIGHRPRNLTVVTRGVHSMDGEPSPNLLGALAEGLTRVAAAELENLRARTVDLDSRSRADYSRAIVAESLLGAEAVVAFRSGRRWTRSTEQVTLPGEDAGGSGTSFLVTGGLGGVALSFAHRVASTRPNARIALVSRRPLPPREEWPAVQDGENTLAAQVRAVLELESLGAEVLLIAADVTDTEAMRQAAQAAAARFGHLDAIFHAAGVLDDAPLLTRSREEASNVLRPKVAGTDAVITAARSAGVPTVILCSSVSAELGLPGQADYAAANGYLNAVAAAPRRDGLRVVSVPFGRWDEVGRAAGRPSLDDGLPFLGSVTSSGAAVRFESKKAPASLWVLNGHRLRSGVALMPGTGFLQAFVAAARKGPGHSVVALESVEFREPLAARDGEAVVFATEISGESVTVRSGRTVHAAARLAAHAAVASNADHFDWNSQPFDAEGRPALQEGQLRFGPRWNVLRGLARVGPTTFATVAMPEQFAPDFEDYDLHPALLDIALSCGIPPEFLNDDCVVAPVRCDRFEVFTALPPRARVVAKQVESLDPEELRFDATVLDADGATPVCRATGMTYRRLPGESVCRIGAGPRAVRPLVPYGSGLTPAAAWPMFDRALSTGLAVIGLSSVRLEELRAAADRLAAAPSAGVHLSRPELETVLEAPRDAVEGALSRMWTDCLGIDGIGVHDNFFDLGGHSLIALRLIARIQAEYGVKLQLAAVQERPTVAMLAELLRGSGVASDVGASADVQPSSNLVVFRKEGSLPPFFCVHGMFGNVMNFTDLANATPDGLPFVGIQQEGVDGSPISHRTIEAMAAAYLEDVRRYQPHGPYVLGGYSAGGCIALEMARQLVASGETVSRVVMLDSWGPAMMSRSFTQRASRMLRRLRFEGLKMVSRKVRFTLDGFRSKTGERIALRNAGGEKTVFADVELGNVVVEALHQYRFVPVDVPVTLITATQREPETRFLPGDLGWRRLIPNLEIRPLSVPHITMCTGTNATVVAAAIADALNR